MFCHAPPVLPAGLETAKTLPLGGGGAKTGRIPPFPTVGRPAWPPANPGRLSAFAEHTGKRYDRRGAHRASAWPRRQSAYAERTCPYDDPSVMASPCHLP